MKWMNDHSNGWSEKKSHRNLLAGTHGGAEGDGVGFMSGLAVGFMACENMARGEIKRQKWGLIMFNICLIPSKKSLRCDKNGQYVLFFPKLAFEWDIKPTILEAGIECYQHGDGMSPVGSLSLFRFIDPDSSKPLPANPIG